MKLERIGWLNVVLACAFVLVIPLQGEGQALSGYPYKPLVPELVRSSFPCLVGQDTVFYVLQSATWSDEPDTLVLQKPFSSRKEPFSPEGEIRKALFIDTLLVLLQNSKITAFSQHLKNTFTITNDYPALGNFSLGATGKTSALAGGKEGVLLFTTEDVEEGRVQLRSLLLRPTALAWSAAAQMYLVAEQEAGGAVLHFVNERGQIMSHIEGIALPRIDSIIPVVGSGIVLLSNIGTSTGVTIIKGGSVSRQFLLPCSLPTLAVHSQGEETSLWYTDIDEDGYVLVREMLSLPPQKIKINLPAFLGSLIAATPVSEEYVLLLFRNGLIIASAEKNEVIAVLSYLFSNNSLIWGKYIEATKKLLIATEKGIYSVGIVPNHGLWWIENAVFAHLKEVVGVVILLLIILGVRKYRRQREILSLVFDMRKSEPIFILDSIGRLKKLNSAAKVFLHLPENVPMRRFLRYYCTEHSLRDFADFADAAVEAEADYSAKVNIPLLRQDMEETNLEFFFTSTPIKGNFGTVKGFVVTGRDITNELQRKKLQNWAQLAHDMQTNLSIIKLNAEKVAGARSMSETGELGSKILFQTHVLIQRIRDLVTIGRDNEINMNGYDLQEIASSVVKEFDASLFPSVEFEVNVPPIEIFCDKPKLVRGLRNAVENAIRALKNKEGEVQISAHETPEAVFIEVSDNGVGMDSETLSNMNKPFFTTFSEQGGTGMGTMIMRHIIHLHGGDISVRSERNIGTTFTFKLPKKGSTKRSKKNAGDTKSKVTAAA